MSEHDNWQPPIESPGESPSTPFGPAQGAAASTGQGWTPPPKPGLIPLRPIDFGALLGASFGVLRRNPKPTYGAALLIYGVIVIATAVVVGLVSFASLSRLGVANPEDADVILAGSLAMIGVAGLATTLVSVIGLAVLQGILVVEVARATLGEKLTLRQLLRAVRGRFGALIGWALLLTLAGVVVVAAFVAIIIGIGALGPAGTVIAVLFGIIGTLGLIVLFAWIGTKVSLVPSAIVLERMRIRDAVSRSWTLISGYFWRTFGIQVLVAFIVSTAIQIISTPLSLGSVLVMGLVDPTGSNTQTAVVVGLVLLVLSYIVTIAVGALGSVVQSATPALIYIDLRIRKEGLDLELIRFVEERQAGRGDGRDPYHSAPHAGHTAPGSPSPASDSPWL